MMKKNLFSKIQILTLVTSFICSVAVASETFLISATDGLNLIVQNYKLEQNHISIIRSNVIPVKAPFGIFNTAILYRSTNKTPSLDVYYGICQDMECVRVTLSMIRLDRNLNVQFSKDVITTPEYWWSLIGLATERVESPAQISFRLFLERDNIVAERKLNESGIPGIPINVAFQGKYLNATAAKDGKMVVAAQQNNILQVRTFNPAGPIREMKTDDYPNSLTLSGPIMKASRTLQAAGIARPFRLLLYRVFRGSLEQPVSRIMMQKLDNETGKFIGAPKVFTTFSRVPYLLGVENYKSVAVTPGGNVVFFTRFDDSCAKELVWAQVLNPQTSKNVGSAQLMIGCNSLSLRGWIIQGMDVAQP